MAAGWREINEELTKLDDYIAGALFLLQQTLEGYERLSVDVLKHKMTQPVIIKSVLRCLYIYSYADYQADIDNLLNPQATAFFFLRQKTQPRAFCLTVGARPSNNGGLNKDDLKTQLDVVCTEMRDDHITGSTDTAALEVMHTLPNAKFKDFGRTLQAAYSDFTSAAAAPRLERLGTIQVSGPWTQDSNGEVLSRFAIRL